MKTLKLEIDNKTYDIIIGNNQSENTKIIKESNQNDLWFHLENMSGPHIILKSNGDTIPKRYLNYIGTLFKEYKNGISSRYTIIYTEIKNIKLTETIGSVITKNTKRIKY